MDTDNKNAPTKDRRVAADEPVWNLVRLDGIKVLLLEDTPDARLFISRLLTRAGAEVFSTQSAEEARQILAGQNPDVIVSDIAMPGEDGLSFMRRVRSEEVTTGNKTPALAFTAFTDESSRRQIFKAGFQAHVGKCSDFQLLLTSILKLVKGEMPGILH